MSFLLQLLLELLLYSGADALTNAAGDSVYPRKDHENAIKDDPRVAALQAEDADLRYMLSEHGLKLRVTLAARKQLFVEMGDGHDARKLCNERIRLPLAKMIQAGGLQPGDVVIVDCVMGEIALRAG